jgi:hypothetical protein
MARVYFQPYLRRRIGFDVCEVGGPGGLVRLAEQHSPNRAYQDGGSYHCIVSANRQGVRLTVKDAVNLAVVSEANFDTFSLADLGDAARVVLQLATHVDHVGECWVYDVTVFGRPSATHYPPSKAAARDASSSVPVKPPAASP